MTPTLVAFSFFDGVQTRTLADSFLCRFEVATDGAGAVTQWNIHLRRSPCNPLDPQHSIESARNVGIVQGSDFVGTGPPGAGPCDPVALAPSASAATQGSWLSDHPLPSDPTRTPAVRCSSRRRQGRRAREPGPAITPRPRSRLCITTPATRKSPPLLLTRSEGI